MCASCNVIRYSVNPLTMIMMMTMMMVPGTATATVKPAVESVWPDTQSGAYGAVTVVYVAGYSLPTDSPDLIPTPIKQAVLLMVGDMYENREETVVGQTVATLPLTAERLLTPFQLNLVG